MEENTLTDIIFLGDSRKRGLHSFGIAKELLPVKPTSKDLLPFVRGRFRSKRIKKKFLKYISSYQKFVLCCVWREWYAKQMLMLGEVLAEEIYTTLNRQGFSERIVVKERVQE